MIGNYGVPSAELDEYGLPKFFESKQIQVTEDLECNLSSLPIDLRLNCLGILLRIFSLECCSIPRPMA
jgi:hypothetical protein